MVMVVPVLLPVAVPMFLTKAMVAAASECSRATNPSASAVVTSASLPLPFIASSVLADERIVATAARGEGGLMAALPPFLGCGGARITLVRRSCQGTQRIREPPPGLLLCHLRCVAKIRRHQPHQEEPCREKLRGARLASTPRGGSRKFYSPEPWHVLQRPPHETRIRVRTGRSRLADAGRPRGRSPRGGCRRD